MKKTILTILLALLLLVPVFAATVNESKNIQVFLELGMNPNYQFDVTSVDIGDSATKLTDLAPSINLSVDKDNLKLLKKTGYYFSYVFTEFENVKMSVSTNGDLTTTNELVEDENAKKIPFELYVNEGETINSSNGGTIVLYQTPAAATKIGERVSHSFAFEIRPVAGSESIKDKAKGTYKSSLTLTVESV